MRSLRIGTLPMATHVWTKHKSSGEDTVPCGTKVGRTILLESLTAEDSMRLSCFSCNTCFHYCLCETRCSKAIFETGRDTSRRVAGMESPPADAPERHRPDLAARANPDRPRWPASGGLMSSNLLGILFLSLFRNWQKRLAVVGQVQINSVQQDGGGRVTAHEVAKVNEIPISQEFINAGEGFRPHFVLPKSLAA